jgi:hypothetical protein
MAAITPIKHRNTRKLRFTSGNPAQSSAPSAKKYVNKRLLTGTVTVCTTITATPSPIAASIFLERAIKVHIPKNMLSAILSMKIDLTSRLR